MGYKRVELFDNDNTNDSLTRTYDVNFKKAMIKKCALDGISLKTVLYATFTYAIRMTMYADDFVVGMVSNHRPLVEDGEKILGCFLNTVPVRNRLESVGDMSWSSYFKSVDQQLIALKRSERLPLYEIAKIVNEDVTHAYPLFDVLFNYMDFHVYKDIEKQEQLSSSPHITVDSFAITNTAFDFNVDVSGEILSFDYRLRKQFTQDLTLEKIHAFVDRIMSDYIKDQTSRIEDTNFLSQEDVKQSFASLMDKVLRSN